MIVVMVALPLAMLLLLAIFINVLRISSRLRSMENLLQESQSNTEEAAVQKRESLKRVQSEYEEFLNQDGKRRMLSKREQSEAFRLWRRQHGKTWGAEEHSEDSAEELTEKPTEERTL